MDLFSISQVARYSGIKPHTIRMWEQRYDALKPSRSKGNTRYYDNNQLRRLLNIVSLTNENHKISSLCQMEDKELFGLIHEMTQKSIGTSVSTDYFISQLIAASISYDEQYFEKIFSHCLLRYGMKEIYTKILYPLLVRIGLMWSADSMPPANEHFISSLLRQKIFAATDSLPPAKVTSEKWLLFLREGEYHEIGLLFASYLIKLSGRQVLYLGPDVPRTSLIAAIDAITPQHLLLFLVNKDWPRMIGKYLEKLNSSFKGKRIFICGDKKLIGKLRLPKKMQWLKTVEDLTHELSFE